MNIKIKICFQNLGAKALKGKVVYKARSKEIVAPVESITNKYVNKMFTSAKLPNRGYKTREIMI